MYKQIASGGILDATQLGNYESQFEEGDRGLLELDLRLPVSQDIAQSLEDALRDAGVTNARVTTASPMLRIYFTKAFPWLAVIAATILGIIVIAILVTGWRLYKDVIPLNGGWGIGIIIGIAILVVLAYVGTREVVEEKAKKVIYG